MKKKLIFTYIISIGWLLTAVGQTLSPTTTVTNTTTRTTAIALPQKQEAPVYKQRYGLRIGADLSKLVRPFFDSNYYGLELVGDYRLSYSYFAAAEIGLERTRTKLDFFDFNTEGQFLRLGFDYNGYGNWYGMENLIYVGARYGFSLFSQQLNSYQLHKDNQYWNEPTAGTNTQWLRKYDGRTAHWLEVVIGIKTELLHNLYAGATVRVGLLLLQTDKQQFPNYYIPAFGKVNELSSFGVNFNYTLTYLIPLYKKYEKK